MLCSLLVLSLSAAPSFAPKARPYDVQHYRLDVRLKEGGEFSNTARITLRPKGTLGQIELDAFGLVIEGAKVNGEKASTQLASDLALRTGRLTIRPARALPAGKDALIEVAYTGKAGRSPQGLFEVQDGALPGYFTHLQPDYAQRFFPCNDQPDDKATSELFVIADARYQVLSNGKKLKDETFSEDGQNLRRVHWSQEQPHSTYLVALAVAELEAVNAGGAPSSTLYVGKGKSARSFIAKDAISHAVSFQERYLGVKYPWAKLDWVAVPRFLYGGMENTSLIFLRENALVLEHPNHIYGRARITGLVGHELAHQWFGNYVTCRWWDDAWLNEGFATFLGAKTEDAYYDNDYVEVRNALDTFTDYFRQEDGPFSRPLASRGKAPQEAFDSVAYDKGAHVLRMLETWLGPEDMKKGLKSYLEKYAFKNASSEEFFSAMGAATKRDLRGFQQAWLHKRGYPVLWTESSFSGDTLTVTIRQQPNHASEKGPFVFKLPIVAHREMAPSYHQELVVLVDKPQVTAKLKVPAPPEWINWNRGGSALAKIHAPTISEQAWVDAARKDPDPVWRLLSQLALLGELVNPQATEQTRPSDTALGALVDALENDPSPYVREALLERMAESRFKRLPQELAKPVLALAKRPSNLPEDAFGLVRVRRAAMGALGKFDGPEPRGYLLEELGKNEIDLNFLPGLAVGTARLGDSVALATVRAAVTSQKARGYPFYKAAAEALGSVENPEVVPVIRELFREDPSNAEIARHVLSRLRDNSSVKSSAAASVMVRELVLDEKGFGDELKGRFLHLLDEVKTKDAKEALLAISEKADSELLRRGAKTLLDQNFPSPKAAGKPKKK